MNENFYIREISPKSINSAIKDVGFDESYIKIALKKYNFKLIKICNITPQQASIIKQSALSSGADAAVHREVITCRIKNSDLIIGGTVAQVQTLCSKLKKQPFKLAVISDEILSLLSQAKHKYNDKIHVMGILNITPDSFSDGGKYLTPQTAVDYTMKMIENGADIIDIGGESTKPFAQEVDAREELNRVIPVIEKIRELNDKIKLSIDTRHSKVAKQAVKAGVNIINDVSGLSWDEKMAEIAAESGVEVVITHSAASPETMQINPCYNENVVDAVYKELFLRTNKAIAAGIKPENIIIDPGIGFGKTFEHNFELIKRLIEFKSLGYPILIGLSRKGFISKTLNVPADETDDANIALNSYAAINGANIIRVHDVARHFRAMQILQKLNHI